jgi:hypothetical protein
LPSTDILNPEPGWDPELGDSPSPSYEFERDRASTRLLKKAIGGQPWTRETQNMGHSFPLSWIGRTETLMQLLKWYYEQYEDGFFTIVDWEGGGRHYVGRFTGKFAAKLTKNNMWNINLTFEEMPQAPMVEYPSNWAQDAIAFFVNNDFNEQKVATSGTWTQTARTAIAGSTWTERLPLTVGASYLTIDDPGTAADWAQYEYRGYGFRLYMLKGPEFGQVDVYVDGVLNTAALDLYNATDIGPQIVLTMQSLSLDFHRVKVIVDGTKNAEATSANVSWYALEVMR